ncbi:MAG: GFA family protein [Pseudomonadota bacterium]
MAERRQGGCPCGAVRFEVTGPPKWTALCHCESCRRYCSAPVVAWMGYTPQTVRWTGSRTLRESSPIATRGFCAQCGTQLSFESTRWPGELHLYAVSLDDPSDYTPELHCHHAERLSWLHLADALPRFEGSAETKAPQS